jgi:hypothetical protein
MAIAMNISPNSTCLGRGNKKRYATDLFGCLLCRLGLMAIV